MGAPAELSTKDVVARARPAGRAMVLPARRWLLLIGLLDFALLAAAFIGALEIRFLSQPDWVDRQFPATAPYALMFAVVLSVCYVAMGLYQAHSREGLVGQWARMVTATGLGGVALAVAFYAVPQAHVGRGVLLIALGLGLLATALARWLVGSLVTHDALRQRVLVLGAGRNANLLNNRMRRKADRRGFELVGFVPMGEASADVDAELWLDPGARLVDFVRANQIDELVIAVDDRRGMLPMDQLLQCRAAGVAVTSLADFFEREAGKLKLGVIDPSALVFGEGFNCHPLRCASKRVFDIASATLLLVLAAPVMILTAIAILLESGIGQPVLYRQERVGEGGRVFRVLKFRSMRTDAEKDGVARWASANDDRITRVGRFIRKVRIDELPQIFNVLRGDMSFVGPRPERPQFVEQLTREIPYFGLRHCVKPGITGWAQLRYAYGASVEDAAEKLKYDLYYVKKHSLLFDAAILLQTVEVVLFGKGAR
jgi:sugar transferase (PEP-CTERM system associated)